MRQAPILARASAGVIFQGALPLSVRVPARFPGARYLRNGPPSRSRTDPVSGEALNLCWDQLADQPAILEDSKTGPKTIWLTIEAVCVLESLPRSRPDSAVFLPDLNQDTVRTRVRMLWQWVITAAAIGRVRLHDLRHSFASVGASISIDLRILAGLLGHADYSSTLGRAPVECAAEGIPALGEGAASNHAGNYPHSYRQTLSR